ncbi:MAG: PKD domain-containing protein [Mariprofundaceae bacterium]|nr:PKD domain-containing protein [Mariprofundaceae bacterium]
MRYLKTNVAAILLICLCSTLANAKVLPGLVDELGNPVHTADEFTLHISTSIAPDPQGYKYSYIISNDVLSSQSVWDFRFFFQDPYAMIQGTASTPWGTPTQPKLVGNKYNFTSYFGSDPDGLNPDGLNPQPLLPNQTLSGVSFVSPYPPGIIQLYAEGYVKGPWVPDGMAPIGGAPAFSLNSPYGPGKVMPVIGPVKPATLNVTNNYSVLGCAGGICDVQLDITGPQDPTGTAYSYLWTGVFGTTTGAKPIVQLAAGNYTVSVTVSDPSATLVTATMPITVVDPNPSAVVNPPTGGGNNQGGGVGQGNGGGGTAGGVNSDNDMDHDGIPDAEDDDRDGDGKPNSEDLDPDHPD